MDILVYAIFVAFIIFMYIGTGILLAVKGHRRVVRDTGIYEIESVRKLDTVMIWMWWWVYITDWLLDIVERLSNEE